jgi:ankyrin repeat protein
MRLSRATTNGYHSVKQSLKQFLFETRTVNGELDEDSTPLLPAVENGNDSNKRHSPKKGKKKTRKVHIKTKKVRVNNNKKTLLNTDVDLRDPQGWTPLLLASKTGKFCIVRYLLETGKVNVNSKDLHGRTPLLLALENRHEAIADSLLDTRQVDVNLKDSLGRTPLLLASETGGCLTLDKSMST